jgi:uncharacterized membrane protein YgdD (TMEM256/DUF423 family)
MPDQFALRLGALAAGLAVALGAIGAHAMAGHFEVLDLERFEKGVRYQMYHALALLWCANLGSRGWPVRGPATCFAVGMLCFCGGLYGLVFTHWRGFAHVTPVGGVAFLIGWLWLALARPRTATH